MIDHFLGDEIDDGNLDDRMYYDGMDDGVAMDEMDGGDRDGDAMDGGDRGELP